MSRKLRPYQLDALAGIRSTLEKHASCVCVQPTGTGKCLGKGTLVMLYDGGIFPVETIEVGDLLMGPDSRPREVVSLSRGREPLYRITPTKGDSFVVNESHILSLRMTGGSDRSCGTGFTAGSLVNISVRDYLNQTNTFKHCAKQWRTGVDWPHRPVPLDPYLLGLWLGDGTKGSASISKPDVEVEYACRSAAQEHGLRVVNRAAADKCPTWSMVGTKSRKNPIYTKLRWMGVTNDRHIPPEYKVNDREVRLGVLAGLLDSDGHLTCGCFDYISQSEALAEDVTFLARSLGLAAYIQRCVKGCQGGFRGVYHRVSISGDCSVIPTRIPRKQASIRQQKKNPLVTGFTIEHLGVGDYYGFELDGPDRLFLLGDFTVTHNTTVAATLMNEWPGGNCLFLAHTRELVDQAAARLAGELGYPPTVEMGLRGGDQGLFYQGGMIVVGSVQSMLTDRRLAKYERHPFDLIVIDESHRATSPSYRKIVEFFTSKNPQCKTVGLTATPNRADGVALGLVFDAVGYAMDIPTAIEDGWLVPVRQRAVVVSDVEITGPNRTNELGEKDFTESAVEEVMLDEAALVATADPLVRESAGRPTIVFCATVRHAHELAAMIDRFAPGSAAAVDGETPQEQRADLIAKFRSGHLQYLCNAQLFVEGFDAPNCACVAVARPTKSQGRYTQMVGRGLRPLPGVVDGNGDAQDRRLWIAESDKPDCLILDFVNAGAAGLVTIDDVLGGDYDAETRALAMAARKEGQDTSVGESLRRAKFLLALEREMDARRGSVAAVDYQVYDRDGRPVAAKVSAGKKRGTVTDGQLSFLISLGCNPDTAIGYSQRQAASVIDSMRETHCTDKQRKVLGRAGIDAKGIGVERASRIIDALKANNWQRPEVLPE